MTATDLPSADRNRTVRTVVRAFTTLEAMADAGGVIRLSQIVAASGLPAATTYRLLRTLVDLGYVRQEPSRQYALGPRLMGLADNHTERVRTLARRYMSEVAEALRESVDLALLDGQEVVCVAQVQPSRNSMQMSTELGWRAKPNTSASGKAILATWSDAHVLDFLVLAGLGQQADALRGHYPALLRELAAARARGYVVDNGEQELGVRCIALALPSTEPPMVLSVSAPSPRMEKDVVSAAVPLLRRAALQISEQLVESTSSAATA